jgi:hypothetical protein
MPSAGTLPLMSAGRFSTSTECYFDGFESWLPGAAVEGVLRIALATILQARAKRSDRG